MTTMREVHPVPTAPDNGHPGPHPTDRPVPDTRPGCYYVSVRDNGHHALLAGPFPNDHPAALAIKAQVQRVAERVNHRAAFYTYGTSWSETDVGPGVLHDGTTWTDTVRQRAGSDPTLAEILRR